MSPNNPGKNPQSVKVDYSRIPHFIFQGGDIFRLNNDIPDQPN
ncbi:MAG: hypothetical protein ACWA6R_08785 [Nitrosomonas sp.]